MIKTPQATLLLHYVVIQSIKYWFDGILHSTKSTLNQILIL